MILFVPTLFLVHGSTVYYKVAIIGRAYGKVENCADLMAQRIEKMVLILDFGTGIEIYPFDDGYIINGEIDLIKVDKLGNKVWDFSGRNIWVRPDGKSFLNSGVRFSSGGTMDDEEYSLMSSLL